MPNDMKLASAVPQTIKKCPMCGWPSQYSTHPCVLCSLPGVPALPLFARSISGKRTIPLQRLVEACEAFPLLLNESLSTKYPITRGGEWTRTMLQPPPDKYVIRVAAREQPCEQHRENSDRARTQKIKAQLYTELYTAQGGLCACCSQPLDGLEHEVDHTIQLAFHEKKHGSAAAVLRRAALHAKSCELLCQRCNGVKGMFELRGGHRWSNIRRGSFVATEAKPRGYPAQMGWDLLSLLARPGAWGKHGKPLSPGQQARAIQVFSLSVVSACPCRAERIYVRHDPVYRLLAIGCAACTPFVMRLVATYDAADLARFAKRWSGNTYNKASGGRGSAARLLALTEKTLGGFLLDKHGRLMLRIKKLDVRPASSLTTEAYLREHGLLLNDMSITQVPPPITVPQADPREPLMPEQAFPWQRAFPEYGDPTAPPTDAIITAEVPDEPPAEPAAEAEAPAAQEPPAAAPAAQASPENPGHGEEQAQP